MDEAAVAVATLAAWAVVFGAVFASGRSRQRARTREDRRRLARFRRAWRERAQDKVSRAP
jgi:hypothetical protein